MKQNDRRKNTFVLISLGSNLGEKRSNIDSAVEYLTASGIIRDYKVSSYYSTDPVGYEEQPEFINAAISGYTSLQPNILLNVCKSIEYFIGRNMRPRWHEREIDIDLIFYGTEKINSSGMTVPHPEMHKRNFVLVPANQIAGTAYHPVLEKTVSELLDESGDRSKVEAIR